MSTLGPDRFGAIAVAVGLASGVLLTVLLSLVPGGGLVAVGWGLTGWAITAWIGVVGGVWLVARHGEPGPAFLIAMGTCMLSRLLLAVVGAVLAATLGGAGAVYPYVAELAAGFLPVQILETGWFMRRAAVQQTWNESLESS